MQGILIIILFPDNLWNLLPITPYHGETRDKYKDKVMTLSKKAREKFKEAAKTCSDGELGELFLFLEDIRCS